MPAQGLTFAIALVKPGVEKWGRDHHSYAFSIWMAGGGVKSGLAYGESGEFCVNVASNPVRVRYL